MKHDVTRRDFIRQTMIGIVAAGMSPQKIWAGSPGSIPKAGSIPKRVLGKTGVPVSILGLGGSHISRIKDDGEAVRFVRAAIDAGVTFLDNAWEYHGGRSEELMGRALQDGYRAKVFLMTKHHGRDKGTALKHLEDSLRRLRTDVIDLWQFHEVIYEDDPGMILAKGGGIEAAEEARKAGKVKYIGFTGHKDTGLFLEMLDSDFDWDAVQMPFNVFDPHFRSFQETILPILLKRNIGVIAMKTLTGGYLLQAGVVTPREALTYVWSQPVSTIVSGMESWEYLHDNIEAARTFKAMSRREQKDLLAGTKDKALTGQYEPFKTSRRFDGWVGRKLHGLD
ncbi:MAG: aldo/keto reductase [bacterium]